MRKRHQHLAIVMIAMSSLALTHVDVAVAQPQPPAQQQQPTDPEQLFVEGSALMEQGKFDEALPKLERAQKADPGIGTLFNIAVCHQKLGRLGTAYRSFRDVVQLAGVSGKKAREEAARAKLAEVKTQVPAFAIRGAEPELIVRIDGNALKKEDWAFYPVDPGEHRIEALAPAKKPWSTTIPTPAGGTVKEIAIPTLEVVKDTITVTRETTNSRRTLGFIFGGVGIAGAITATVTGLMLLNDHSKAEQNCPDKVCRRPDGTVDPDVSDAVARGQTLNPINAISVGVAVVGIGVGAFFLLTSGGKKQPSDPPKTAATPRTRTAIVPRIDNTSGGLTIVGSF